MIEKAVPLCATHPNEALLLIQKIRTASEKIRYAYGMAHAWKLTGNIFNTKGQFDSANNCYQQAITWCDTTGPNRNMIANLYNNIAATHAFQGEYDKAVLYYQQAIAAAERFSSVIPLASIYNNLSVVLNETEQYSQALYYLNRAEKEAAPAREYLILSNVLLNKANVYMMTQEWSKASSHLNEALRLAQIHHLADVEVLANSNLGTLCLKQHQPIRGKHYLQIALGIKAITNPYYRNTAVLSLGEAYLRLKQYDSAAYFLQQSLETASQAHISRDFLKAHAMLATVYEAKGNYRKAYEHEVIFHNTSDSLLTIDKTKAVSQMEVKYRTAQKDKEIAEKQIQLKERDRELYRKNIWISSITAGAALLILLMIFIYASYRQKQRLQQKQMQILLQQQEIRELKAIMDGEEKERTRMARELHDSAMVQFSVVKMNLNTLLNESDENLKKDNLHQVQLQLNEAITELRNTAHNLMPDMLLQEGLLEALYYFCNNLQRNTNIKITLEHYGNIPPLHPQFELSAYRIIQELMQNIIKHAQATEAILQISCRNDILHITVEDNGVGMEEEGLQNPKGMGLKSIFARARTLNGQMEISSRKGVGTTLTLEFEITNVKQEPTGHHSI